MHTKGVSARVGKDPQFKRLQYVRYADDFLIGVIGSKEDCLKIREDIAKFLLGIKLSLSLEKTRITHASTTAANFLGAKIR